MNDEFHANIIVRFQTCSVLMLSVISALHHVQLLMDRILLLLVPVETEVDPHTANKVCSDSTGNEQVKMSVCLITFDGSSANVTLFSSREILLFLEWFWRKLWLSSSTHSFLFINILGSHKLLFHQSTMHIIYCVW